MQLLSGIQVNAMIFGFTLCGYGVISFLVADSEKSQSVTIPYRVLVLLLNLILVLYNLKVIYPEKRNLSFNTLACLLRKTEIISTLFFVSCYSFRVVYDVFVRTDILLWQEPQQYILFWFFITLIPSLNFLFLDDSKYEHYLIISWLFHCLIGGLAIFSSPSLSDNYTGRLSEVALNSISLGQFGTSLFLLSMILWLRYSAILGFAYRKWYFLYPVGSVIGIITTMLSGSRSSITASLICFSLILFTAKTTGFKTILFGMFLLLAVGLSAIYSLSQGSLFIDRMFLFKDEFDPTGTGRGFIYDKTLKTISECIVAGCGIELPGGGYPHNLILESFLPFGFVGGALFIGIVGFALRKALGLLFDLKSKWSWLGILFIQYTILGLSSGSLYGSSVFWYLLFAILGVDHRKTTNFYLASHTKT
jgi:O-antigen ligase